MRKQILALAAAMALVAGAAQAGVVLVDPDNGAEQPATWRWIEKPDAFKMALVMTNISRHDAHTGDVGKVECVIGPQRRPINCHVLGEPPKSRLGQAAARLASYYKAPSHDDAGQSPIGRTVRVNFALNADGGFES